MADPMTNVNEPTEALQGVERQTLGLIAEDLTSAEWAKLLAVPLERAAAQGNRHLAQKLMQAGAGMGGALHAAVGGGHGDIANDLLESGASVETMDRHGGTPLHIAASRGQPEMVQLLLRKGADKDALDGLKQTPLFAAIENNNVASALALLAGGADVSLRYDIMLLFSRTVLHIAVHKGNAEISRATIEHGADVNATDSFAYTALHVAALRNMVGAIDVLVEAGANIEARAIYDATPLRLAVGDLKPVAVTALLKHGADVNAQDDTGQTPLHAAAINASREEAAELFGILLRSGADVNAQDDSGETPLHNAARKAGLRGVAEVVDFLLRSGADETITNEDGDKAEDVVSSNVDDDDVDFLEEVERVEELLANAPADRAWRRRGYLVLCRAHPDRVQLGQDNTSKHGDTARKIRSRKKLARAEASGCEETIIGGSLVDDINGDWAGVVVKVLGLQEAGVFRMIVGYL